MNVWLSEGKRFRSPPSQPPKARHLGPRGRRPLMTIPGTGQGSFQLSIIFSGRLLPHQAASSLAASRREVLPSPSLGCLLQLQPLSPKGQWWVSCSFTQEPRGGGRPLSARVSPALESFWGGGRKRASVAKGVLCKRRPWRRHTPPPPAPQCWLPLLLSGLRQARLRGSRSRDGSGTRRRLAGGPVLDLRALDGKAQPSETSADRARQPPPPPPGLLSGMRGGRAIHVEGGSREGGRVSVLSLSLFPPAPDGRGRASRGGTGEARGGGAWGGEPSRGRREGSAAARPARENFGSGGKDFRPSGHLRWQVRGSGGEGASSPASLASPLDCRTPQQELPEECRRGPLRARFPFARLLRSPPARLSRRRGRLAWDPGVPFCPPRPASSAAPPSLPQAG